MKNLENLLIYSVFFGISFFSTLTPQILVKSYCLELNLLSQWGPWAPLLSNIVYRFFLLSVHNSNFWVWLSSDTLRFSNWPEKYWDSKKFMGLKIIHCMLPSPLCGIFANISGLGDYFSNPSFVLKHWVQAGRFEYHEPYNRNNCYYHKVSMLFRGFCYDQQNETTKNENGIKKNVCIFKSNAPILLKLGVGLDHMCAMGWIFLDPAV